MDNPLTNSSVFTCFLVEAVPGSCASAAEVGQARIVLLRASRSLVISDMTKPMRKFIDADTEIAINPLSLIMKSVIFQRNRVFNDNQDLFEARLETEFIDVEKTLSTSGSRPFSTKCSPTEFAGGSCVPYMIIEARSGGNIVSVLRTYEKALETFAEIGGFGDLTFILFGFFYAIYNGYSYRSWLRKNTMGEDLAELRQSIRDQERLKELTKGESMKDVEKTIDGILEGSVNAVELIKKVERMALLVDSLFRPSKKELITQLLLRRGQRLLNEKKKNCKGKEVSGGAEEGRGTLGSKMGYEEAYDRLKSWEPENEVGALLKSFYLKNLPDLSHLDKNGEDLPPSTYRRLLSGSRSTGEGVIENEPKKEKLGPQGALNSQDSGLFGSSGLDGSKKSKKGNPEGKGQGTGKQAKRAMFGARFRGSLGSVVPFNKSRIQNK